MEAEVARRDIERLEREVQSLRAKQSGNKASF